jgi:cysteine desulfurase
MPMSIYLDNAATTPALPAVAAAVNRMLLQDYGNPSSLHNKGLTAEKQVKRTRRLLATILGGTENEIYFTSGGTEANNLAILGATRRRRGRHVITTAIEHAAVLAPYKYLEQEGWQVTILPVDHQGHVSAQQVADALRDDTALVSVMMVNNEVGTVQPLREIAAAVKARNKQCLLHTDAIQALGKIELDPEAWGIDLLSVSAHKIHGPKGVGALWLRSGIQVEPLVYGGGQERGLRSGTENVPGIVGFGAALEHLSDQQSQLIAHVIQLREAFISLIQGHLPEAVINSPLTAAAPHICSIALPGLRGEVLVHALAQAGVYVSSGAACSSHHPQQRSHVLQAMGLEPEVIEGTLRFGLSYLNTMSEIEQAVDTLVKVVEQLKGGR